MKKYISLLPFLLFFQSLMQAQVVQPKLSKGNYSISGNVGTKIPYMTTGNWSYTVRHQYSKVGAWNKDQSKFFILNRDLNPNILFYDGQTLEPLNIYRSFAISEFRWDPNNANRVYYVGANEIGTWDVVTNQRTVMSTFPQYSGVYFGPWEGNISDDGEWVVIAGNEPVTEIFVYNLFTGQRHATISHGFDVVDFATISPTGNYVLVAGYNGTDYDRAKIFDRQGNQIDHWTQYGRPSHYDLTLDANGNDIAVGVSKSAPDDGSLISRRLSDGQVTRLMSTGYAWHTSARNVLSRGKVVASFAINAPSWGPWSDSMLMVSTSGYDQITGVTKQYAVSGDYWAETQPVFSPDGKMVLWAKKENGYIKAELTMLENGIVPNNNTAPYCNSLSFSKVQPITNVSFANVNIAVDTSNAIAHNTYLNQIAEVVKGQNYTLSLKGDTKGNHINSFKIYIDWNNNGNFDDIGEALSPTATLNNSTGYDAQSFTYNIQVPTTAATGFTRIRIVKLYQSNQWTNACHSGTPWGHAIDFVLGVDVTAVSTKVDQFKAQILNNMLQLNWDTKSDPNAHYFEIEASSNGKNFVTIGKVDAQLAMDDKSILHYDFSMPLNQSLGLLSFMIFGLPMFLILKSRRAKLMAVLIFMFSLASFISCKKKASNEDIYKGDYLYVRIKSVDKIGVHVYSNVIKLNLKNQ